MGFPAGYSDLQLPKLLLHFLFLLSLIRHLISSVFHSLGLPLDVDPVLHHHSSRHPDLKDLIQFPAAVLYEELASPDPAVSCCAVCLQEFLDRDEVRPLAGCRHVFHRRCLDPWFDLDQWTCPLCRAPVALAGSQLQTEVF